MLTSSYKLVLLFLTLPFLACNAFITFNLPEDLCLSGVLNCRAENRVGDVGSESGKIEGGGGRIIGDDSIVGNTLGLLTTLFSWGEK